jgi:hypothetical protein
VEDDAFEEEIAMFIVHEPSWKMPETAVIPAIRFEPLFRRKTESESDEDGDSWKFITDVAAVRLTTLYFERSY